MFQTSGGNAVDLFIHDFMSFRLKDILLHSIPHLCRPDIWPSEQALALVSCGHGFYSHPDGQGV